MDANGSGQIGCTQIFHTGQSTFHWSSEAVPFTGRVFWEKPSPVRRGGGWAGWGGDACVARSRAGWQTRTRATQASPPHVPSTPAPTEGLYLSPQKIY